MFFFEKQNKTQDPVKSQAFLSPIDSIKVVNDTPLSRVTVNLVSELTRV